MSTAVAWHIVDARVLYTGFHYVVRPITASLLPSPLGPLGSVAFGGPP